MSEPDSAVYDEEVFGDELPDETLEVAGSKCWEGPASLEPAIQFRNVHNVPRGFSKLIISVE